MIKGPLGIISSFLGDDGKTEEVTIKAHPYSYGYNTVGSQVKLVYDRIEGKIVDIPDTIEIQAGGKSYERHPEDLKWIEDESGEEIEFDIVKNKISGGYEIEDSRKLNEAGVLSPGGSGLSGIIPSVGGSGGGGGGATGFLKSKKGIALILILFLVLGGGGLVVGAGSSALGFIMDPRILGLLTVFFVSIFLISGGASKLGSGFQKHPFIGSFTIFSLVMGLVIFGGLGVIGDLAGDTVIGQYAQVGEQSVEQRTGTVGLESQRYFLGEQFAKLQCALQGPHCLREWRLNNTREPDSRDVGETYGLEIRDFRIGAGDQMDIRGLEESYPLSTSFSINNIRHGHKGIDARDVQYRIRVTDHEHDGRVPYCDTGWLNIRGIDMDEYSGSNHLPPGMSYSTGSARIVDEDFLELRDDQELRLGNCNMIRPGAGQTLNPEFQVKYDYSSRATLYFEAVSQEYAVAQNIEVDEVVSETADTPVQAALRVQDPVVFEQGGDGSNDRPVDIGATLVTDDFDVDYKVQDLELTIPDKTEYEGRWCSFNRPDSDGSMQLESDARDRIIADDMDDDIWFSQDRPSPEFGCDLELDREESFNPSGETLIADLSANYTVRTTETISSFFGGSFEAYRSTCTTLNCPVLTPINMEEENGNMEPVDLRRDRIIATDVDDVKDGLISERAYWKNYRARCDGTDSFDGCTAVEEYDPDIFDGGHQIDSGDLAVYMHDGISDSYLSCELIQEDDSSSVWGLAGLDMDDLVDVTSGSRNDVIHYTGGEFEIREKEVDVEECGEDEEEEEETDEETEEDETDEDGSDGSGSAPAP